MDNLFVLHHELGDNSSLSLRVPCTSFTVIFAELASGKRIYFYFREFLIVFKQWNKDIRTILNDNLCSTAKKYFAVSVHKQRNKQRKHQLCFLFVWLDNKCFSPFSTESNAFLGNNWKLQLSLRLATHFVIFRPYPCIVCTFAWSHDANWHGTIHTTHWNKKKIEEKNQWKISLSKRHEKSYFN